MASSSSIEMEKERLTAEVAFKDSSVVIRIKRSLPDFLQTVKLKYVKLGYMCTCDNITLFRYVVLLFLIIAITLHLSGVLVLVHLHHYELNKLVSLGAWTTSSSYDELNLSMIGLTSSAIVSFFSFLYWLNKGHNKPIYLVDFACYKPLDEQKISVDGFVDMTQNNGAFLDDTIEFQKRISTRSGLGDETYLPSGITAKPPRLSMREARAEAEAVMFGALDSLFAKTG
ncbi:hypothetical protein Sjap_005686 [Stephania japonica]|uniref:FAE domain-containing protein n=1 Tax=Stephania japonica TaxID=461633 RepID=A0AAP0K4J5_9MAGN